LAQRDNLRFFTWRKGIIFGKIVFKQFCAVFLGLDVVLSIAAGAARRKRTGGFFISERRIKNALMFLTGLDQIHSIRPPLEACTRFQDVLILTA
jgi:hypothetical protein